MFLLQSRWPNESKLAPVWYFMHMLGYTSENTGLWQLLPNVSSASEGFKMYYLLRFAYVHFQTQIGPCLAKTFQAYSKLSWMCTQSRLEIPNYNSNVIETILKLVSSSKSEIITTLPEPIQIFLKSFNNKNWEWNVTTRKRTEKKTKNKKQK